MGPPTCNGGGTCTPVPPPPWRRPRWGPRLRAKWPLTVPKSKAIGAPNGDHGAPRASWHPYIRSQRDPLGAHGAPEALGPQIKTHWSPMQQTWAHIKRANTIRMKRVIHNPNRIRHTIKREN